MSPGCHRRAFTIPEVLISMGLFSLILTGVYLTLTLSLRFQSKVDDPVTTFQRALSASSKLGQAISLGVEQSVSVEFPEGLAFVSAQPPSGPFTQDASGNLEYHKFVFFYLEDDKLYKGEVPFSATTSLPATPTLATLKADSQASKILVAEKVVEMVITTGSGASTTLRVQGDQTDPKKLNEVTLRTRVTFRQ